MKIKKTKAINEIKENETPKKVQREKGKIKNEISDNKYNEINENIVKEKQFHLKQENEKVELNAIIKLLKLEKDKRTKSDINAIKDYLCSHIDYFKNFLEQSEEKLLKLIPSLNYEVFKPNERIMNFGEEGDKCYILLKGKVGIYKPFPITKH